MKKIHFPILLATALCLTACSNDDDVSSNDDGKALISLGSVGQNNMTRAGFTDAQTTLKIHYVSTRKANSETFPYNDGMNDDGTTVKPTLYMSSSATAAIDQTGLDEGFSTVTQTTAEKRFWDDAHGRNSLIALYAIAVPNKTSITKNADAFNAWDTNQKEGKETTISHEIIWTVSNTQTSADIADEDLAYSNNVSGDKTIGFNTGTKTFEKAEGDKSLVFNHALSRFTINVKKGEGFGVISATEFNVTTAKLTGMTTAGTLNVASGTMTSTATDKEVTFVGTKTDYTDASSVKIGYKFCAQVFPGVTLQNVETTMLTFVIDGNNYNIKGKEIYEALTATASDDAEKTDRASLKAGKNYNLNITINKKGIEITSAKLIDWEQITGSEQTPTNDITVYANMESTAGTQTTVASDIYRSSAADGKTGYASNKNTLAADNTLGTKWYWPDNSTQYHFRTISPQNTIVTSSTNDYITMTGGAIADGNDYIWGAPLKETHKGEEAHKFTYNDGYATYLYPAIGVTDSKIHITQFHVMSNIEVNLSTSDDDSKLDLTDAKVELMGFYNTATLDLYDAKITTTGSVTETQDITRTENTAIATKHTYRVIPQAVASLKFKITAQGNIYYVDIKDVLFNGSTITNWLPGEAYVYKFKLTKKGIDVLSAKLVDWTTITGNITDIDLES